MKRQDNRANNSSNHCNFEGESLVHMLVPDRREHKKSPDDADDAIRWQNINHTDYYINGLWN